jgi:hypothetical protein
MYQWFEQLRESWVVRFWVVRGAILLLVFLILLIVIFDMNWLSIVGRYLFLWWLRSLSLV